MNKTPWIQIIVRDAMLIVALTLVCGALFNSLRPAGIPWTEDWSARMLERFEPGETIDTKRAYQLWRDGSAVFVDARDPGSFAYSHIPGAMNVPPDGDIDAAMERAGGRPMVIYCQGLACHLSDELAAVLKFLGHRNYVIYPGGIEAWREAGHPDEQGPDTGRQGAAQ